MLRTLSSPFTLTRALRGRNRSLAIMSRSKTTVAVCQIRSTGDPAHNLRISETLVRKAVESGATICFLPEASDFIHPSKTESRKLSRPLPQHHYTLGLQELAKELQIVISAGVHEGPEDVSEERVYNTHVLIGKDGSLLAAYRKLHLFDVELQNPQLEGGSVQAPSRTGESARILAGQRIVPPVEVEGVKIGLEICYDIRFPELSIILTRMGAEVLLFPSAFTIKTGRDHWYTLCKAAAIQYQTYVIASAQYGAHNSSRTSWGETIAFDPWGRQLGRLRSVDDTPPSQEKVDGRDDGVERLYEESGEFFLCEIDLGRVKETRDQIPLGIQKRSDVYGVVGEQCSKT